MGKHISTRWVVALSAVLIGWGLLHPAPVAAQAGTPTVQVEASLIDTNLDTEGLIPNEPFQIEVRCTDLRNNPGGVFSCFANHTYDPAIMRVDNIVYSDEFPNFQRGTVDNNAGTVTDGGAVSTITPPTDTLVYTLNATALAGGDTIFTTVLSGNVFSEVTVFGLDSDQREGDEQGEDSNVETVNVEIEVQITEVELVNTGFDTEIAPWGVAGSLSATTTSGYARLERSNSGEPFAFLGQGLPNRPRLAGTEMSLTMKLGALEKNTNVVVALRDFSSNSELFCFFTVPGTQSGDPVGTYTLAGPLPANWDGFDVRINHQGAVGDVITADDIVLEEVQVGGAEVADTCTAPDAPTNTNLLANGDFASGATNWFLQGTFTGGIGSGQAAFTRTDANSFALLSNLSHYSVPNNAPLELSVQLGNTSNQPKQVTVALRQFGGIDELFCLITVPPNQSLTTVEVTGSTNAAWSKIDIFIYADDFGAANLLVDNVDLQVKTTPVDDSCDLIDPPLNTQLAVNGGFTNDAKAWFLFGDQANSTMADLLEIRRTNTAGFALAAQPIRFELPIGQPVELTVDLGNTSAVPKHVTLVLKDLEDPLGLADESVCFVTVPPNTSLATYTVRGITSELWDGMDVLIFVDDFGAQTLQVDNVTARTTGTFPTSPSGTDCIQPATPDLANIVINSDFAQALTAWFLVADFGGGANAGEIQFTRTNTAGFALLAQPLRRGLGAGAGVGMSVDLGNSANVPKHVTFGLRELEENNQGNLVLGNESLFCQVTVPANTAPQMYTLGGSTTAAWDAIDLNIFVDDFNVNALRVDNVGVAPSTLLNGSGLICNRPATPSDSELLVNGDFGQDFAAWNLDFDITGDVIGGVANLNRTNEQGFALLRQRVRFAVNAGDPLELTLDIGNSSNVAQNINVGIRNADNVGDFLLCPVALAANQALGEFTFQGEPASNWSNVDVLIWVDVNEQSLRVDNVSLEYQQGSNFDTVNCDGPVIPLEAQAAAAEVVTEEPTPEVVIEADRVATLGEGMVEAEALANGAWLPLEAEGASAGMHLVSTADTPLVVPFDGAAVGLTYTAGPTFGGFIMAIDGEPVQGVETTVDTLLYGVTTTLSDFEPGEHTLTIVPTGTVAIDTITVFPAEELTEESTVGAEAPTDEETPETAPVVVTDEATPEVVVTDEPTEETTPEVVETDEPTPEALTVPAAADLSALVVNGGWSTTDDGVVASDVAGSLTWMPGVSLTEVERPMLQVLGQVSGEGIAEIRVTIDGEAWTALGEVSASDEATITEADLTAWLGQTVIVQVIWGPDADETGSWTVSALRIVDVPVTPEPTEESTPEPTEESTPEVTDEATEETTPEVTPEVIDETTPEAVVTEAPADEATPEVIEEAAPESAEETSPEPTDESTPEPEPEAPAEEATPAEAGGEEAYPTE